MIDKTIQMKKKNKNEWENLFPLTKSDNVIHDDGKTSTEKINNNSDNISMLKNRIDVIDEKVKNVYHSSELGINPNSNLSDYVDELNKLNHKTKVIFDYNVDYKITEGIVLTKSLILDFNNSTVNFERDSSSTGIAMRFIGDIKGTTSLYKDINKGDNWISVLNTSLINIGDLIYMSSDQSYNNSRDYYNKGGTFLVTDVKDNNIKLHRPLPYGIKAPNVTITISKPISPTIKNLNILNVETLERGVIGIQINHTVNAKIKNVFSDGFNDCFQTIKSVLPTFESVRSGRSLYDGSEESYGLSVYMCSGVNVKNSILTSGRHGFCVSGTEPSYDTHLENNTYDNETDDGLAGLDFHESNFNATIIGGSTYGASLAGNITCLGVNFLRTQNKGKNVGLGRYNVDDQSNYIFLGCWFADEVTIRSSTDRKNEKGTNSRIGSVIVTDCISQKLKIDLFPRPAESGEFRCTLLKVSGTNNVYFNIGGHVEQMIIENMVNQHDNPTLTTQTTGVNLSSLSMKDVRILGRTGSIGVIHKIGRLRMDNVLFHGTDNTFHFKYGGSGVGANANISNCDLNSLLYGIRLDNFGIVTLNGNVNGGVSTDTTATQIRKVMYE